MVGRLDEDLGFHETALRLRAQRQQVLATNIANADTPNYKARDFDFAQAMQSALSAAEPVSQGGMALTHPAHLPVEATNAGLPELKPRSPKQNNLDGNTVEMDVERSAFTENALRYEVSATLIHSQIKDLLSVLQG